MKTYKSFLNESCGYIDDDSCTEILNLLYNAFKEEVNAWYGYFIIIPFLIGPERTNIAKFYAEAADDELNDHAKWILERVNQLGGSIASISSPTALISAKHSYIDPITNDPWTCVESSLLINIKNEEGAIETYKELEMLTRDVDPATNRKVKEILAEEEEHLTELNDLLRDVQIKKKC